MSGAPAQIQLALISHTNNGKTTLARTLIGADVGEVRDAAHVTIFAESHTLLSTAQGDALLLWDTPGFGNSVRLLRRIGMYGNPLGWFLREVFDRYRDRPFWLSQQALRTAKDEADVVLYLVNAAENPSDAGYLDAEMQILEWLGKPVMVLLNQMGPPRPPSDADAEQLHWRRYLDRFRIVRAVLPLDAFARCWVHERVFYDGIGKLLPDEKKTGYARLVTVWEQRNARRFRESMESITNQLAAAVRDSHPVASDSGTLMQTALRAVGIGKRNTQRQQDAAMNALLARLEIAIAQSTRRLLSLYSLDPSDVAKVNARVRENFAIRAPIDKAQAGLLGAIVSGAISGLSADLMSGGLTVGAGALVGSVVGALTFAGAAWGFNSGTDRQQATVRFSDEFLRTLLVTGILRYLAVIHFGRGRGNFIESEAPAFWQQEVERCIALHDEEIRRLWQTLRNEAEAGQARRQLSDVLASAVSCTLDRLYPGTPITVDGDVK